MSALVFSKILSHFVNTLTTDDKYSRRNMQIFQNNMKPHYLKNKRIFLDF